MPPPDISFTGCKGFSGRFHSDADRLEVKGTPVPVLRGLAGWSSRGGGTASFGISSNGTLVYISGDSAELGGIPEDGSIVAMDFHGKIRTLSEEERRNWHAVDVRRSKCLPRLDS